MASLETVERLFKTLRSQQEMVVNSIMYMVSRQFDLDLPEEIINTITKMVNDKIQPKFVEFYTETFTDEEIEEVITIYTSPVFKKLQAETPRLLQVMASFAQEIQPELNAHIGDVVKDYAEKRDAEKREKYIRDFENLEGFQKFRGRLN